MRVFNQNKTIELDSAMLDMESGQLVADKLLIAHHEAVPFKQGKTVQEIAAELEAQGAIVEVGGNDRFYRVVKEYEGGGRDTALIEAEPDTPAQDAYDEYEDIQVYVLYTDEELQERRLTKLRAQREPLLSAFDKWEKAVLRGREDDSEEIMSWYHDLLDLKEAAFTMIPERIEYYL